MTFTIDPNYPSIEYLRRKAQKRMPRFAYDYLLEGCNDDLNVVKNAHDIQQIELMPQYLKPFNGVSLKTTLLGREYDAPFGVSAVGLQSLMWPKTPEILAQASVTHNLPFMLSTVTTMSIEKTAKITNGNFWFQLYHPSDDAITSDLLKRAHDNGCEVLVIISDVPTFGYRPKDIYNGLSMPPKMLLRNILSVCTHPAWALETLKNGGIPKFKSLEKYMQNGQSLKQMSTFMDETFDGRLSVDKIKRLRDQWPGKIVIKGIASIEDADKSVELGLDGIIVSNHGGRQHDAGPSSIKTLPAIAQKHKENLTVMMDGGVRSGPDIARVLASGAEFVFMGRPFMYGTAALGQAGGDQVCHILKRELQQVMEQIGCENTKKMPDFLI